MTETEIRGAIRRWLAQMGAGDLCDDSVNLVEAGTVQSMRFLELVTFVADTWGIDVGPGDVYDGHFATVNAIVAFVLMRRRCHAPA